MPKSTTTANDALNAFLRGVDPSWRGNANRYLALHTADPGVGGSQTTNEATYTSYARVSVVASTGFSAASGGISTNTGLLQFPKCTGGSNTLTHLSIGTAASGAGQIIYSGPLNDALAVALNIKPQIDPSDLTISES